MQYFAAYFGDEIQAARGHNEVVITRTLAGPSQGGADARELTGHTTVVPNHGRDIRGRHGAR